MARKRKAQSPPRAELSTTSGMSSQPQSQIFIFYFSCFKVVAEAYICFLFPNLHQVWLRLWIPCLEEHNPLFNLSTLQPFCYKLSGRFSHLLENRKQVMRSIYVQKIEYEHDHCLQLTKHCQARKEKGQYMHGEFNIKI